MPKHEGQVHSEQGAAGCEALGPRLGRQLLQPQGWARGRVGAMRREHEKWPRLRGNAGDCLRACLAWPQPHSQYSLLPLPLHQQLPPPAGNTPVASSVPGTVASTQELSCCPGAFSLDRRATLQLPVGLPISVGAWDGSGVCRSGSRILGDVRSPNRPWHVWVVSGTGTQEMLEQAVGAQAASL